MVSGAQTCYLLDVNVLLALAWPQHAHHAPAHDWFRRLGGHAWATCAITQLGFVRISANPRITVEGVTPRVAAGLLARIIQLPGHRFWPELPAVTGMPLFAGTRALGHQQVTDLYLLGLALHHHGRLATFDRGIPPMLAEPDRQSAVELLG